MHNSEIFMEYLPFLIPLMILELGLAVTACVHVVRHPHYRFGNMALWVIVVLAFQIIGPVVYFVFGRGERE